MPSPLPSPGGRGGKPRHERTRLQNIECVGAVSQMYFPDAPPATRRPLRRCSRTIPGQSQGHAFSRPERPRRRKRHPRSEFTLEQLCVGLAPFVGEHDLGAEAEHRHRAIEPRGWSNPVPVLAGRIISRERKPLALKIRPPELAAGADRKAPGQRRVRPYPGPASGTAPGR